jgi:hypothetical protein
MRSFFLKAGATFLTVAATGLSAVYVTTHFKNPNAPLRPVVLNSSQGANVTALGGSLTVGPSVKPGDVQPVTSTYAS